MEKNKNIEQILKEGSKQNDFSVPEGYFEQLPGQIIEKINVHQEQKGGAPERSVFFRINPVVTMAAAVVAFAVIGYFYIHSLHSSEKSVITTNAELISDILPEDVSEEALFEFVEKEQIFPLLTQTDDADTETIIDYLVDEGVDETLLAQQL